MREKMKANLFSIILIFLTAIALTPSECVQDDFMLSDESPDLFATHEHSKSSQLPSSQIVFSILDRLRIFDPSDWSPIETSSPAVALGIVLSTVLRC